MLYQKKEYRMRIKIFNEILEYIAELVLDKNRFISTLQQYLFNKLFYINFTTVLI
jgi:hypothetical protein